MAHRFIDTCVWSEDWFCELGSEHQLFWNYITCSCDNAGIWKPNKIDFEIKSGTKINLDSFLRKVNENGGRERIYVTDSGRWFLTGFIAYQWFNKKQNSFNLALSNKLHTSLYNLLITNKIPLQKVRGLKEVLETSKEKEREKERDLGIQEGKGGTGEKPFFRINGQTMFVSVSEFVKKNFAGFVEQWVMKSQIPQNEKESVLSRSYAEMDTKYQAHDFNGLNHVKNAFMAMWAEVVKAQKLKQQIPNGTTKYTGADRPQRIESIINMEELANKVLRGD